MTQSSASSIQRLRKAVEDNKARRNEVVGREKSLLERLADHTGLTSLKAARADVQKQKERLSKYNDNMETGVAELQEEFEW